MFLELLVTSSFASQSNIMLFCCIAQDISRTLKKIGSDRFRVGPEDIFHPVMQVRVALINLWLLSDNGWYIR